MYETYKLRTRWKFDPLFSSFLADLNFQVFVGEASSLRVSIDTPFKSKSRRSIPYQNTLTIVICSSLGSHGPGCLRRSTFFHQLLWISLRFIRKWRAVILSIRCNLNPLSFALSRLLRDAISGIFRLVVILP